MSSDKAQHGGSIPIDAHDLAMVTSGSSPMALARDAIFAVDTAMRGHYDALRARVIEHLSPVIVVQYDLGGGTYTLVRDGTQTIERPVPPLFQLVKSICHTPLGIYSVIAPYLASSHTQEWKQPLTALRSVLDNGLLHLGAAELPAKAEEASREILGGGIRFIEDSLTAGGFSIDSFEQFTSKAQKSIHTNMKFAAEAQIDGVLALLRRWREQLGPTEWRNLYAVVLAIWTTEVRNQNWLLLKNQMDPTTVDSHLITLSTAAQAEDAVDVALDNLARIVQDNVAAAMIFPKSSKKDRAEATALAGPDDLLSDTIEKSLRACPRTARSTPLTFDATAK